MIVSGEIKDTAYKVNRTGQTYLMLQIEADRDYFVNIIPWARWIYKDQLEKLGVDLKIFYEWDDVDLVDQMFPSLGDLLPGKKVQLYVTLASFRGRNYFEVRLI